MKPTNVAKLEQVQKRLHQITNDPTLTLTDIAPILDEIDGIFSEEEEEEDKQDEEETS